MVGLWDAHPPCSTYQWGMKQPGGHLLVSSHHTQVTQEVQLGPKGPRALLTGVDLGAHLLQELIPVLVLENQQLLRCEKKEAEGAGVCVRWKGLSKHPMRKREHRTQDRGK